MEGDVLDKGTRGEIEKVVWRVLRDTGNASPPVDVPTVVDHLELHREFYDLQDPTFLDTMKHRIVVGSRRLVEIVRKVRLVGVLLYDEETILVDSGLPPIKHDWTTCHEVGHRVLAWHKTYFRGDTAQTLDPAWQEELEAEANYAASELMFCGPVFREDARDVAPDWRGLKQLLGRYGKSMTATLRRFVEHGRDGAMAMMASTPYWKEKPADQQERWRHFAASPRFRAQFGAVTAEDLLKGVDRHVVRRRGGPVGSWTFALRDDGGVVHEFSAESFYNRHYILTLFVALKKISGRRIVVPTVGLA